jgi:hypothetical protein
LLTRMKLKIPRIFAEKVLMYLWNDAFRMNRDEVFDTVNYPTLEDVINGFVDNGNGLAVFKKDGLGKKLADVIETTASGTKPIESEQDEQSTNATADGTTNEGEETRPE